MCGKHITIGCGGPIRSGKTTVVRYLAEEHGARVEGFGDTLRAITKQALTGGSMSTLRTVAARELFLPTGREASDRLARVLRLVFDRDLSGLDADNRPLLQELSSALRSPEHGFGEGILANAVCQKIHNGPSGLYAIDSMRRLVDLQTLRYRLQQHFAFCYLYAGVRTRFLRERESARSRGDAEKTFAQFKREDMQESEREVALLRQLSDVVIHTHRNVPKEHCCRIVDDLVRILRRA